MNKLLVGLVLSLGVAGSAHALQGDAAAGEGKVAICSACHGADGNSAMANWPMLAGQGERYLLKQLTEIKDGVRVVPEMTGMLTNLSDQDLAEVINFIRNSWTNQAPRVDAGDIAKIRHFVSGKAPHITATGDQHE